MGFRLELVQGGLVLSSHAGEPLPLRSYKNILSALGYSEKPLTREQLIAIIWPDVGVSIGRNRLRVALVKLRHLLPRAILETDAGLTLDPAEIAIDAREIREELDKAQDCVTIAAELETLSSALAIAGDGSQFDRLSPGAAEFGELVARSWLRVSELAGEFAYFEQARDAARAATLFDPDSAEGWSSYVLAHWRLGTVSMAVTDAIRRAPNFVQEAPAFREAVLQVRSKHPGVRERTSSDRRSFWLDILSCIEESRPDLMRSILSAPQTLSVSGKQPRVMHDMLENATPLDADNRDSVWERSAARMIGLKAWLGDAKGVLATAPPVLESSQDDQILRAVWNAVAVAHSLVRDWDQAYEALDRTMDYSRRCGSEMYELTTRGNGAYFLMQQGRFGESAKEYATIIAHLNEIDTPQSKFEQAIAAGNSALIPFFQGDWENALAGLESAIEVRTKSGVVQMGILHASLALVRTKLGRTERVLNSMRLAFLDAFESDSFRSQQFTFEIAAATISVLGDAVFGRALANWVQAWREESDAPRSEAERLLVSRIPTVSNAGQLTGEAATVGKETMQRLRALISRSG